MSYWTIKSILDITTNYLKEKRIENPRLTSEILLAFVLNYENRLNLYLDFDKILTPDEINLYRELIKQRLKGKPIQYITGFAVFYGLKFIVNEKVLIPRPETESLVEKVFDLIKKNGIKAPKILDIGTGSGNIIITLAYYFKNGDFFAIDISKDALKIAKNNCRNLLDRDIFFINSNLLDPIKNRNFFDIIVSNPPYVAFEEKDILPDEVKLFEPSIALYSKDKGGYHIKNIIDNGLAILKSNGWIAIEIGEMQKDILSNFLDKKKYISFYFEKDLAGKDRFLFIRKK